MKIKIIIGLAIFTGLCLFIISFLHKVSVKGHYEYSTSKSESKQNGFYLADYIPTVKTINLKLRKGVVVLDTTFAENAWYIKANNFISTLEKADTKGYNIAFKIKSVSMNEFVWGLDFKSNAFGQIGGFDIANNQYQSTIYDLPDTIRVFFEEKDFEVGWQKPIVTDTIIYVKHID